VLWLQFTGSHPFVNQSVHHTLQVRLGRQDEYVAAQLRSICCHADVGLFIDLQSNSNNPFILVVVVSSASLVYRICFWVEDTPNDRVIMIMMVGRKTRLVWALNHRWEKCILHIPKLGLWQR
jgi:hypothetical protein